MFVYVKYTMYMYTGYDYLLMQSAPCAVAGLARFLSGGVDLVSLSLLARSSLLLPP